MKFQARIMKTNQQLKAQVAEAILKSGSLEELLICMLSDRHTKLKIAGFEFEDKGKDLVIDLCDSKKSIAVVFVEGRMIRSRYKYLPLPEKMPRLCDTNKPIIDEEWLDKRDLRLKIRIDPWQGERVAPPTSLAELVLSYAFSSHGVAEVSRDLIEIESGIPDALKLKLVFLGSDPLGDEGWIEEVCFPLDKLTRLLEKRKKSSSESDPSFFDLQ